MKMNDEISTEAYKRAESFLPWNAQKLIKNGYLKPNWIENSSKFWYLIETDEKREFLCVDPKTKKKSRAFDHNKLTKNLNRVTGKKYSSTQLPFDTIEFKNDGTIMEFNIRKNYWSCDLTTYECTKIKREPETPSNWLVSPDRQKALFIKDYNAYAIDLSTGKKIQLTKDGEKDNDYGSSPESNTFAITLRRLNMESPPIASWSPDSKKILIHKINQKSVKKLYLIQSVGLRGSSRPLLHEYHYPLPQDDERALCSTYILDLEKEKAILTRHDPYPLDYLSLIEHKYAWWGKESKTTYIIYFERGHDEVTLCEIDVFTGDTRTILTEKSASFMDLNPNPDKKPNVSVVNQGKDVIWYSERDGWGHLYLYDCETGEMKNQITSGEWVVHDIILIDEEEKWIYFTAGGREPGIDPYYRLLYRVHFDGASLQLLTPEPADHDIIFSPDGKYFIDNISKVDEIPHSLLRSANGELMLNLEKANINKLMDMGWKFPERFTLKARDNTTDLYGVIFKPINFTPKQQYPIIDFIYPGPQRINTPKSFPMKLNASILEYWDPQALAELGFIVIVMDGFGTPLRSKKFLDYSYGKMEEAGGLEDHVKIIKELAKSHSFMNLEKVGIYGHSGGGYASARAILEYPDFYKVAVSSAGNHDQRGYVAGWGEKYQGLVQNTDYTHQANSKLANNLKGKLFLVCGDMDDNVHFSLTYQLADALIKANKDFDMLVLPNRNHYFLIDEYFIRKRWDYFVRYLLDQTPSKSYKIKPPSMEFIIALASQQF